MLTPGLPQHRQARLEIPASIGGIVAALDCAQTLTAELGFHMRDQQEIRLALEEVAGFLARSTMSNEPEGCLDFLLEWDDDGLLIRIRGKGLPLDLDNLPLFSSEKQCEHPEDEGLSLHLARSVADRIDFVNCGREGLEVRIRKNFRVRPNPDEAETPQASHPPAHSDTPCPVYVIRPPQDAECVEISRCAYLAYGYTYEDYIYHPQTIARLIREGAMHSLIAVTDDGEVMGHCALKCDPKRPGQAELGVLFVKPAYRKHGLGKALWAAAIQLGRDMGLETILVRSVTGHRASQMIAAELQCQECALILALFPRAVDIRAMGGVSPGKMSGVIQWLALRPPRERTLFLPDRYATTILELYQRLRVPVRRDAPVSGQAGPAHLRATVVPVMNVASLEVAANGSCPAKAAEWVAAACRRYCREKRDAIHVSINIEEPCAPLIVERCIQAGFIFSGISPDVFPRADALVLQYINQPENPFDGLAVWTDSARALRDFIREEWLRQEGLVNEMEQLP